MMRCAKMGSCMPDKEEEKGKEQEIEKEQGEVQQRQAIVGGTCNAMLYFISIIIM